MRAEIISIGDELTSGQSLDTNSQWLSQRLGELGVIVAFHTTVGDNLQDNVAAFQNAMRRADLVIASGGLGPTADDLTRDALATAVGADLVQDDAALEHIRQLFARRGRPMPDRNVVQAQFPRGSRVIPNPHGTAPGIDLTVPRDCCPPCRVFALPGVPAELFVMWQTSVAPAIRAAQPATRVLRHRRIKCFGVGESDLEAMLPDMIRRQREPLVGITVSGATITLRITASGPNEAAADKAIEPTVRQIYDLLGALVFGEEDDELQHAVVRLLNQRHQSIAVAEWATDGLVSEWLAEAATDTNAFRGGVVVRDPTIAQALMGVSVTAESEASSDTAADLARAVREKCRADWGLGIAAFPTDAPTVTTATVGPADARERSGTLHVALAAANNVRSKGFPVASHPAITKARAAKQALNMLRLAMLQNI